MEGKLRHYPQKRSSLLGKVEELAYFLQKYDHDDPKVCFALSGSYSPDEHGLQGRRAFDLLRQSGDAAVLLVSRGELLDL